MSSPVELTTADKGLSAKKEKYSVLVITWRCEGKMPLKRPRRLHYSRHFLIAVPLFASA